MDSKKAFSYSLKYYSSVHVAEEDRASSPKAHLFLNCIIRRLGLLTFKYVCLVTRAQMLNKLKNFRSFGPDAILEAELLRETELTRAPGVCFFII